MEEGKNNIEEALREIEKKMELLFYFLWKLPSFSIRYSDRFILTIYFY